ncbi:MAG: hypothetical protein WCV58_04310 [Patescibacteria group bacterium]
MNTGQPTQDEKDLVNRNQQINQSSTQKSDDQNQTMPVAPPPPPPVTPTEQNIPIKTTPPNPPSTPVQPPVPNPEPENRIPLQQPSEHNVGVGTPNIGVEEKTTPAPSSLVAPVPPTPAAPPMPEPEPMPMPTPPTPAPKPNPVPPQEETPVLAPIEENETLEDQKPKNEDENVIEVEDANFQPATPQVPKTPENPQPVQVKNYQNPQDAPQVPQPPVKASALNASLMALILVALVVGSAGGFFGFKYWDNFKSSASSVEATPTATNSPSLDVNTWSNYTSNLYDFSLKYPNGWQASTTDPQAETLVFASNKESLTGEPTGYKIEINFQNSNDKTLKQWVEANTVATGEKKAAKEITVSNKTAYQQELSKNGPKVATYIERPSKVMVVTYSAPESIFGEGGQWYNNFINSIQLN